MPIRAVVFDFGGVLVRTTDLTLHRAWETRLGLPAGRLPGEVWANPVSEYATTGRATPDEVWRYLGDRFGLNDDDLLALQRDFFAHEALDADLVAFLRGLRPSYRTAILSNAWPNAREEFTGRFGLGDAVDQIIISAEEGIAKPDICIYSLTAARLGVHLNEMLFVDDFAPNVTGARAAGMQAILFATPAQALAEAHAILAGSSEL
ncbi:MAG: hypothetical protein OJF49_003034 [Ktedonobacterales bacterium]|jgi:putative hydrolase of the HAD superfamily|nr:MAG: hypothetical protein OJF49_003034 [Ktedonobacterales bacterium]